jgi:cob(I)alamin adenosyltransferase
MPSEQPVTTKGLISVFTGNGKGKTTAALGLVFRALGHGKRVCFIQFIKGKWKTGESLLADTFSEKLDFHTMGRGFTRDSTDPEKDRQLAREAWDFAVHAIVGNQYDMIVLDELTYLIRYNMVEENQILSVLSKKPAEMHLVITGRYASEGLLNNADLITEMTAVKHPYTSGLPAQKGFEY